MVLAVWRELGNTPYQDSHSSAPNDSATSLTVASDATTRYEVGDRIEWPFDGTYERAEVTAVAATTLTIRRGIDGTTAASHAANAVFVKSPVFSSVNIQRAIQDAIAQDLYPDLFAVYETQITYSPTTADWYEIDASAEEVFSAYQKPDTGNVDLLSCRVTQPRYVDATLASTSKKAIRVERAQDNNNTIFVQYLRIPAVGDLSEGMRRVVEYGACKRLLEWRGAAMLGRTDVDQDGVHAPGAAQREARWFSFAAEEAKRKEKNILNRRFPRRERKWFGARHYNTVG